MNGRDTFSEEEIARVRKLLRQKDNADRDRQKRIRRELRDMNFYITHFSADQSGYTEFDLDRDIRAGAIKVVPSRTHAGALANHTVDSSAPAKSASAGLPPLLKPGLLVVFVGTEPGNESIRTGHYYADPSNSFYRDLHSSGFTPKELLPELDRQILDHGIGLDDAYSDPGALRERIAANFPQAVCFNSKGALKRYISAEVPGEWRGAAARDYVSLGSCVIWALPDSSGKAASYHDDRLRLLRALRKLLGG